MRLCLLTLAPLLNEAAAVRRSSSHNTAARYLRPENVSRDDSTYTNTAGSLSDGDGINFDKANLKNLRLFDNIDFSIESHFNGFQLELGQESNDVEPNKILAVIQCGFLQYDRVLRPARVIVARAPSTPKIDEKA